MIQNRLAFAVVMSMITIVGGRAWGQQPPACGLVVPDFPANAVSVELGAYYPDAGSAVSLFTARVLTGPIPETPPAPLYAGWCADANTFISVGQQGSFSLWSGYLFSSMDPDLNAKLGQANPQVGHPASCYVDAATWRKVNFIINHRDLTKPPYNLPGGIQGYTVAFYWDVQEAINTFVGGPRTQHNLAVHEQVVAVLTNTANAYAASWTPQCGVDKIAAVAYLDPTPFNIAGDDPQLIFFEVLSSGPPTMTCPAGVMVSRASDVPPPDITQVTAAANCPSGSATVAWLGDVITDQSRPDRFTITRIYRATNGCGLEADCAQSITVLETAGPAVTLLGSSNVLVECHSTYTELGATAVDPATGSNLPVVILGAVDPNAPGIYTVLYAAVAPGGNSNGVVRTVQVVDTQKPMIGSISATQNQPGAGTANLLNCAASFLPGAVNLAVQASDACGLAGPPSLIVSNHTSSAAAIFVSENPSGTFNYIWTPSASAFETWTGTVIAADGSGNAVVSQFTMCRYTVTGFVELENFSGTNRAVTFVSSGGLGSAGLLQTNVLTLTFMTNGAPAGVRYAPYALAVPGNALNLSAKTDWSLRRRVPVTFGGGQAWVNFTNDQKLLGGDLAQGHTSDNEVNTIDYYTFIGLLGQSVATTPTAAQADITGDGSVNTSDYTTILGHIGQRGDPQ